MNKCNWLFNIPTKLIFGSDSINEVGEEASRLGSKALIVTGTSAMQRLGYTEMVKKLLEQSGVAFELFAKVESNPRISTVEEGVDLVKETECNLVIGLGGGSVIDAAKAIASSAGLGLPVQELMEKGMSGKGLPCIAIPTTSGTGAEVTGISVLTNSEKKRKDALRGLENLPNVAIIDPTLTLKLPPYITANTGMDALTHAIEAYTSKTASPVSDLFARKAISLVNQGLRRAVYYGTDLVAREKMALASNFAGMAIALAGTGAAHGIGMTVGGITDADHGTVVGLALPEVIRYNLPAALEKYRDIAELMGEKTKGLSLRAAAELAAVAVTKLLFDLNLPQCLSDIGVTREMFPELLADTKAQKVWLNNARAVSDEDKEKFFEVLF